MAQNKMQMIEKAIEMTEQQIMYFMARGYDAFSLSGGESEYNRVISGLAAHKRLLQSQLNSRSL
jgi:hypothetical protein